MFVSGYNELCRKDLSGGKALEVCCAVGDLALGVARAFPRAEVMAMDRYPEAGSAIREAQKSGDGYANVRYICGDALNLEMIRDETLDLVFGQAALHHLGHDTDRVGKEYSRVLKPGGRLVFIFEPLGVNPLFAMIRAFNIARAGWGDESNVAMCQLEDVAKSFSSCEVHPFNFLGYPFKALGRLAGESLSRSIYSVDQALMNRSERLARWAANFNVVYTK
jgi:SAM-dependent methyltransferase